jgi:ribosomal-protein-alanine acetyltransferase
VIFPADEADVARIAALEAGLLGADAWSGRQLAEELVAPGRRVLVFTAGGDIAGYVITMTLGEVCDLQRIGVDPAWQRGGVGGELLGAAARFAVHDGAERMLLEVAEDNAAAIAFYRAAGFTEIDRRPRYYRNGADALVLALGLRPDRAE